MFFFFFSSRRRHTRCSRDWSSDVCSSDLGARDTLRLEMKYALYGNDIDDTTNALEAGLGWGGKPAKGEVIGRGGLEKGRRGGGRRRLGGGEMGDKAGARPQIGRGWGRGRGEISGVGVSLKKKK